jgi:phosphotransferase family enzyme
MNVDIVGAVRGDAGLAGVQWMLHDAQPQEVLRQALAALLPAAAMLGNCRLHRAKYKPGRYLTAYYEVALHNPDSGQQSSRQIEVSWMPEGAPDSRGAPPELLAMQAEAIDRGLAAPFRELTAEAPEWGMRLQIAPLDVRFPQLARVSDPQYVGEMLAAAGTTNGSAAPRYDVTAIRYRPGQRHVLRYSPADAAHRTIFAKIYNSDKGARTFGTGTRAADWLASQSKRLKIARPAAYLDGDGAVLYPLVSGTPLSDLLRASNGETARLLGEAGAAVATLHRMPLDVVDLQPHSFAKEIKSIASASAHVHTLLAPAGAAIDAILDRAQALHARLPQEPTGFAYGDCKADHLWVTPDGLTLIDFDTCYLFDPAIDLGKFLADLQWWYDTYGQAGVAAAQEQFLAGYAAAPAERLLRARLYEALVLVKTTVRRVKLFERDWAKRTTRLIERAGAVIAQIEGGLG